MSREAGETCDEILGLVEVFQARRGYRFSLDAVLLADFVSGPQYPRALEIGVGSGVVSLLLAALEKVDSIVGVEVQAAMAERARRSVEHNGLTDRVQVVTGDIGDPSLLRGEQFDLIVSNPPFRPLTSGKVSPNRERAVARHEIAVDLRTLAVAMKRLLRSAGKAALVYPAARMAELCATLESTGLRVSTVRPVYPARDEPAELVLVEASKAPAGELRVLPPLFVHEPDGGYTREAAHILRKRRQTS